MQATITRALSPLSDTTIWKIEIGFNHVRYFPSNTEKSYLIRYAMDNGAQHIKFMTKL